MLRQTAQLLVKKETMSRASAVVTAPTAKSVTPTTRRSFARRED